MEMERNNRVVVDEENKDVGVGGSKKVNYADLFLRFTALILSLAAALIIGLDKQTKIVAVNVVSTLPPLYVPVTAKFHYLSAFTYFVVANALACSYGAVSLILKLANRGSNKSCLTKFTTIFDIIMLAVLASANGAAGAVGVLGLEGNDHVHWNKVCNIFGKFCNLVLVSLGFSLLGSLAFVFLVMLAVVKNH
ncbi:hypothetical protein POM88_018680 [Heracleum sosnowskyi]|uniref:CASP-like protein n=1 Tax=Heracleum sosnowskyi TaxID=360622 RepID=A0AAD8IQZ8_9APIA|nr:hypothetical protein POM88_018676 [Heracleum sosnowskyi]KAK1390502.1 hypothetical protein POM88_018680 [Heracleum sosnowskyi]